MARTSRKSNNPTQLSAAIAGFPDFGESERIGKIAKTAAELLRLHSMTEGDTPDASIRALIQRHSSDVKSTPKGPDIFHKIKETDRWTLRHSRQRTYELAGVKQFESEPTTSTQFDEAGQEIARLKRLGKHATRPEQQQFSAMIRKHYQGRCAITGCMTSVALEAAHIRVEKDVDDNSPQNGLLLRADIHALFDALLITLSEDGTAVEISDSLIDPSYAFLRNAQVFQPETGARPSLINIRLF